MAMEFTKAIDRLINLKVGNKLVPAVLTLHSGGVIVKTKGRRKAITATWEQVFSQPDLFAAMAGTPALTNKEATQVETNPLAFLADGV